MSELATPSPIEESPTTSAAAFEAEPGSVSSAVEQSLQHYFKQLDGQDPNDLYNLVLAQIEVPLLREIMTFTRGNQSKAAKFLGISRGTLRKKLAIYQLD